jgi:hypothetical protein
MKLAGFLKRRPIGLFLICWILMAACSLSGSGNTPPVGGIAESTPTTAPSHPCTAATQELPPRVDPVVSPTNELSQWVHIQPGNFERAVVETESGSFTAPFKGGEGASVEVKLLANTVHHLKVTVQISRSKINGCIDGGYSMTVFGDRQGQPLVIIQGKPASPSPSEESFAPENMSRLRQLSIISFPDNQRAQDAIFAPGDVLLTYGFGQGVRRWQVPTGQPAGEMLVNGESMTTSAALSSDGGWMATGSGGFEAFDDNQTSVRLWNLKINQVRVLGHHPSVVESLAFNPGSTLLASGGNDNTVMVWDVVSGNPVGKFTGDVATLTNGTKLIQGMRKLIWVNDSTVIARGDAVIYAWNVSDGKRLIELGGEYQDMDFNRRMELLAVVRGDGVYQQSFPSGKLQRLPGEDGKSEGYLQVAFSPDGKLLVGLSEQKVTFWDTSTQKIVGGGRNPAGVPLVFSPEWRYLAWVSWENHTASLWAIQP